MTMNIAHRGFSGKYPENTMIAFEQAVRAGCDGIENDIRYTADRQIIIMHDDKLDRITNGDGFASHQTLAELKKLRYDHFYEDRFPEARVCTLREYLDFIRTTDMVTNIEIKSDPTNFYDLETEAIDLIRAYGLEEQIIFSSFNHYSMALCHKLAPEIRCGLLGSISEMDAALANNCGAQYLHPHFDGVTKAGIAEAKSQGIGMNVWTVNDEPKMQELLDWGVHGIITNYPDRLRAVMQK